MDDSVRDHDQCSEAELAVAVAARLPQVYKDNLIILINEAIPQATRTQSASQRMIEDAVRLLFSYHSFRPGPKSVAFFLQCLSALGFERHVGDQLNSKADKSFSLSTSYPRVQSRADEIKKKIKEDLASIGVEIDMSLHGFYVELVRLSLTRTLLPASLTKSEDFCNLIYNVLNKTSRSPSETASIIHSVLRYFHCNAKGVSKLDPYSIQGFSLRMSYPKIFFKLRFAEFLCSLGEDDCKLAMMMIFSRIHLIKNEAIDKYSPLEFIERLFHHGEADIAMLNKLAEHFHQPNYFSICEQQQQNETDTPQESNGVNSPDGASAISLMHEPVDEDTTFNNSATVARLDFMTKHCQIKKDDFRKLQSEGYTSQLPEINLALAHSYPPLSKIVYKNFTVHLEVIDKFKKNLRQFSQEEQIAIQLAIQGLNVSSESLFSNHVLTHPLVYELLDRLGYPVNELVCPTEIERLSIYLEYPDFDMLLTLAAIVLSMSYQESEIFERNLRQDVVPYTTSIISICDALTRKHKSGVMDMNEALWWLEKSEYKEWIHEYFKRCSETEAKHKALLKGMEGSVSINYIKIVICGPPCVGKTAFKNLLANKKPPLKHHSTPIAARPVHAIERIAAEGKVWKEITKDDLLEMLSDIIRDTEMKDNAAPDALSLTEADPLQVQQATKKIKRVSATSFSSTGGSFSASLPAQLQSATASSLVLRSPKSSFSSSLHSPRSSIEEVSFTPPLVLRSPDTSSHESIFQPKRDYDYVSRKIMSFSKKMEETQMLHEATWIYLLDSGGQPQFTDLLRMFVRGNSLYIIVMKVTESLDDKPTFVYSIDGKALNMPTEMTMTNLQIIERFVRSVAATSREDNSEPAFAIIATHCDKAKIKRILGLEERIREKNETLLSCLNEFLDLFIFYNRDSNELIFPVDNLCKQPDREKFSAEIRQCLISSRSDIRFSIDIPIHRYVFDLNMKNEASKETHGMISLESCYSLGRILGMNEKEVDECLIYLDSMRLCIYYPKLLPHVIFTNPQFLIKCLSDIVRVSFVDDLKQILPVGVRLSKKTVDSLKLKGIFDQTLLDSLGLTFIPNLFSKKNLLSLLQKFRVISSIKAPQDNANYFIPILLPARRLTEEQKKLFSPSVDPLFITFDNKLMLQGLFPTLVVSLLIREEEPLFFIDSRTSEFRQQLRHAVKLYTEELFGSVFLCENNESIEVYFTGRSRHCYRLRKVILEALSVSVKVLEYDEEKLQISALVHCNRKHNGQPANDKKIHSITISPDLSEIGCSIQTSLGTISISDLSERQSCWLRGTTGIGSVSLPTDGDAILSDTHVPVIVHAIKSVVPQWDLLGVYLEIENYKLNEIKHNSYNQIEVCRKNMICHWIDTGYATCNKLKAALEKIGKNSIVRDIQNLQTA